VTTKPELKLGRHLLPAVAALALFAVMAVVFLTAPFSQPNGFPEGALITASIGYAMFNIPTSSIEATLVDAEGFLVAFILIAIVLDVAIDAALFLAKRESDESLVAALQNVDETDDVSAPEGGRPARADGGEEGGDH
jgi:NADH-quinone oxidoreductase subunit J